jgi:hypothetical protein
MRSRVCVCAKMTGAAARKSLRRDRLVGHAAALVLFAHATVTVACTGILGSFSTPICTRCYKNGRYPRLKDANVEKAWTRRQRAAVTKCTQKTGRAHLSPNTLSTRPTVGQYLFSRSLKAQSPGKTTRSRPRTAKARRASAWNFMFTHTYMHAYIHTFTHMHAYIRTKGQGTQLVHACTDGSTRMTRSRQQCAARSSTRCSAIARYTQ